MKSGSAVRVNRLVTNAPTVARTRTKSPDSSQMTCTDSGRSRPNEMDTAPSSTAKVV